MTPPFGPDASTDALPAPRLTQPYNIRLVYAAILRDVLSRIRSLPERARHARDTRTYRSDRERCGFQYPTYSNATRYLEHDGQNRTAQTSEFESVLLTMAGHDRQPLQVIQGAHEFLDRGVRTASESRLLQFVQSAIDRLSGQLDELGSDR